MHAHTAFFPLKPPFQHSAPKSNDVRNTTENLLPFTGLFPLHSEEKGTQE